MATNLTVKRLLSICLFIYNLLSRGPSQAMYQNNFYLQFYIQFIKLLFLLFLLYFNPCFSKAKNLSNASLRVPCFGRSVITVNS